MNKPLNKTDVLVEGTRVLVKESTKSGGHNWVCIAQFIRRRGIENSGCQMARDFADQLTQSTYF